MNREEAAAKASYAFMENSTPEMFYADSEASRNAYLDDAKIMLAAADAHDAAHGIHRVAIDDATVERAARAIALSEGWDGLDWSMIPARYSENFYEHARAVLAAAVEVN